MKRWIMRAAGAALLVSVTGCVTMESQAERDRQLQQVATINQNMKVLIQERQTLTGQVDVLRQDNGDLSAQVRHLTERLDLVEQQYAAVDANYKGKLQELQVAISSEGKARETAIKDVVRSVSQEISNTATQLQDQQRQLLKAYTAGSSAAASAQGEYVVQKGDTLGAIARAFKVTTESLQKANKLSGATIHVGQKLVIPKS